MGFKLESQYQPTGDQPKAIDQLTIHTLNGDPHQTLLGVTGSGKTFTVANLIKNTGLPTLIISHNKTLAAQLYQEFRDFFPSNAVSYFVSYYDYYQPEAYIPTTDTYIEKETDINDEIDKLRLSATTNLLTRPDCIVVASVSCIYNLGSPVEYGKYILKLAKGQLVSRKSVLMRLADLQYTRTEYDLKRGTYRLKGDVLTIWPAYQDNAVKLTILENVVEKFTHIDPITAKPLPNQVKSNKLVIYPAKHYLTDPKSQGQAFSDIKTDLQKQINDFKARGKIVESHRLEQKVSYDLENIQEFGFVNGIENYSRYFDGRKPGDPPYTLLDYFDHNAKQFHQGKFLTIIDESHITIPQMRGMHHGDRSRKETLIEYGFRLPSALDNRPLKIEESLERLPQIIYTSATPGDWEIEQSQGLVTEQIIRPTGLLDPIIELRPTENQIEDLIEEIVIRVNEGTRALVTTLTKKMAEALTDYLNDQKKVKKIAGTKILKYPKVQYLHSDIDTLERSEILSDLRKGEYDVVVGINLLREGLDLPEVSLVAILDADKEGFLRSKTSLVQTIGRAARHEKGRVIMYADKITPSMKFALDETDRRRLIQHQHNQKHGQTPYSIQKPIRDQLVERKQEDKSNSFTISTGKNSYIEIDAIDPSNLTPADKLKTKKFLTKQMNQAAKDWDFEKAAKLRDAIVKLEK